MSFENSTKRLNENIAKLLEKYDEKDIISPDYNTNFLEQLQNDFNSLFEEITPLFKKYNKQELKSKQKMEVIHQLFLNKNNECKMEYLQSLSKNTAQTSLEISKIKKENEAKQNQFDEQIKSLNKDIIINNSSTEQKIVVLNATKKNNIELFDYHIKEAKNNYTIFISKSNDALQLKNEALHSNSSKRLFKFDESNKSLLDFLNKKIAESKKEYEIKQKEFDKSKFDINDSILNQSIKLNNKINALNSTKNDELVATKKAFDQNIVNLNAKREELRNLYNQKNKDIVKKFAQNLTDIDSLNEILYNKHQNEKDQLTRKFYYDNFNFDKEYFSLTNEYEELFKNYDKKNNPKGYKILKNNLRIKQNQFEHYKKQALISQNKQLNEIELAYIKESEKFKNQKYIYEIEKKYDILNLTMEEKNAHDKLNHEEEIYEREYNTNVQIINQKFYIRANELRSNNEIRNKLFQKDLIKLESNYRIASELILRDIAIYQNDINFQNELDTIVHTKEETIYNKEKGLNEVITLLEIEKNKILNTFNKKNHELYVKNETIKTDYEIHKLNLESSYANKLLKHEIEKLREQKKEYTAKTGLNILELQNNESLNRLLLTKNYILDLNYNRLDLYNKRFRIEKFTALFAHSTFENIIHSFTKILTSYLDKINKIVKQTYMPLPPLITFINELLTICLDFYNDVMDDYSQILHKLFEERIAFETGFKYKNQFDELESTFNKNLNKINSKKESFDDTLANYNKTITVFTNKIYSLQNEKKVLEKELFKEKITDLEKRSIINKLAKIKVDIREFTKKNDITLKLKSLIERDMREIPNQIKRNKIDYENKYHKIYKEQHNESLICYKSLQMVDMTFNKYKDHIKKYNANDLNLSITSYKEFFSYLNNINFYLNKNLNFIKIDYEKIMTYISYAFYTEQRNGRKKIEKEHKSSMKDYNDQKEKLSIDLENSKIDYENKNQVANNNLASELRNIKAQFNKENKQLFTNYEENKQFLRHQYYENINNFKIDLYATKDNLHSFILKEQKAINDYEVSYKENRNKLTTKYDTIKKEYERKYQILCNNINEQILNQPYITKLESKQIDKATKEENMGLKERIVSSTLELKLFKKQTQNEINLQAIALNKNLINNNFERNNECRDVKKKYSSHVKASYKTFLKDKKR